MRWREIGASIPIGWFASAATENQVCTNCGYVRMFITDRKKLEEIAKKWPRVQ